MHGAEASNMAGWAALARRRRSLPALDRMIVGAAIALIVIGMRPVWAVVLDPTTD
jgi:hypothetical protein